MKPGKKIFLLIFICGFTWSHAAKAEVMLPGKDHETMISLNGIWNFKYLPTTELGKDSLFYKTSFDTSSWGTIKVPGHWELQGFAEPHYGRHLKAGTGLYKTTIFVPANWKDHPIFISFDGVLYGYQFWINGKFAGEYNSAYNRRIFDISQYIDAGSTAQLAVKVSTRSKGWEFDTNDCWSLSGIYRDVNLFSLPDFFIKDLTVTTPVNGEASAIEMEMLLDGVEAMGMPNVVVQLFDPNGHEIMSTELSEVAQNRLEGTFELMNARLWTAESPYLYRLRFLLNVNNQIIQKYDQNVGIRQISWENGVFKINGKAVKLRGVNRHDLSPVNGRALTEEEMLEDLKLIRMGNANFVRTSHYPSHPRFMELCDSIGLYVMCEVPFGFGEQHLNNFRYLPLLKERARATIQRDKNHPSVIAWSVGNENPLTQMCLEVGRYVKQLDETRPYCFPMVGSYYRRIADTIPEEMDVLASHYPLSEHLINYANTINRPMFITEYAHSLGLDGARIEAQWEIMYRYPAFAGGAVWHLFDQGILQVAENPIKSDDVTTSAWIDSVTFYNNFGDYGADGVLYANRIPQVTFFEMRKVYSPVIALDDTLHLLTSESQYVNLNLINRYDFTSLSQTSCRWNFFGDTIVLASGMEPLTGAPHDTTQISVKLPVPNELSATFYYLKLELANQEGEVFYEKTYPVRFENIEPDHYSLVLADKYQISAGAESTKNISDFIDVEKGKIQLHGHLADPINIIGPFARVGRKKTMSEISVEARHDPEEQPIWSPNTLTAKTTRVIRGDENITEVAYRYERGDIAGQFINATINYSFADEGGIRVDYRLVPENATGYAMETGLSFIIPHALSEFRWVGKGPYPAYPGKSRLSEFGIYHLNVEDINYQGNRQEVELALFTDAHGNGFALIADKDNIAVERASEGILLSHNAVMSGRYNKNVVPETKVLFEQLNEITGSFSIIPINNDWPEALQQIFGLPNQTATPFQPFFNSYDQW